MRRGVKLAVVAIATITLGSALFELDRRAHRDRAVEPGQYLAGEVERVDPTAERLVLRIGMGARFEEAAISTPANTRIIYRHHRIALAEVRVGDHATVRLHGPPGREGRGRIADQVRIARSVTAAPGP